MAVAALSTSVIALATAPAAAPAPAAGETPEAFARLVSRARPDGQAAQSETAPQPGEPEIETVEGATDAPVTDLESEDQPNAAEKPVDLLAELEALFAYAGQIGVDIPVRAPAPAIVPTVPTAAAAAAPITTMPQSAPVVITTPPATTTGPFTAAATPPAPTPTAVGSTTALPAKTGLPAESTAVVGRPALPPTIAATAALTPAADAVATGTDGTENVTLRRDIASIVASLKAAFHPAEANGALPRPVAGQAPASPDAPAEPPAPNLVAPLIKPLPSVVAPEAANVTFTPSATAAPASKDATVQASVMAAAPQAPEYKAVRPSTVPAEPQLAIRVDAAAIGEAPDMTGAGAGIPIALTDAPAADAAEQAPTAATPVITPAPATPAPVIPAAVTPSDWSAVPPTDTASAAAPSQVDQTVTRHLDLARDTQWLDQLARDISQSVTQQNHLKFQLNPEHLGALTVEIANSAAGTAIKLSAETDQARAIIADAQPRLIAEVRAQGVRVAESHVDLNQQGSGNSAFAQNQQRQSSEDSKPFVRTQAVIRDDAGDSAPREDGELYA